MIKRVIAVIGLLLSVAAGAQPSTFNAISTQNLNSGGACTASSCVIVDMKGKGAATVQTTGTWTASGGLSAQITTDGSTWVTLTASDTFTRLSNKTPAATIASGTNDVYRLSDACTGATLCRITALGAVTGAAIIATNTVETSAAGSTSITGATDGVAQGSTTSGQSGVLTQCAVTTGAPSYTTGQTSPLSCDTSGNLRISGGGGGSGTSSTVGSAVPSTATAAGASDGTNMQLPRVADVDSGAGTQYALVVSPRLAASGGAIEFTAGAGAVAAGTLRTTLASDDPAVAGIGGVSDAAATQGSTGSVSAKLRTVTSQLNTQATAQGAPADSVCASDTGTCAEIPLLKKVAANITTLNTSVNADPNYTQAPGSAAPSRALAMGARSGANLVAVSQANATAAINVSTATTTQLVALSSGQVIHVTAASVISAGTGNITFVYGTGTNCGTGTTSITGAYPLIANSGLSIGSGLGPVFVVPAGNALCVTTSAAVQMSGHVAYTQFTP